MDFSRFVGLAWADHGRGPDGFDCWALFRMAFAAGTGIALADHGEAYATSADKAEIACLVAGDLGDWREIRRGGELACDGALLRIGGNHHIGLVTRRGFMLHMPRGKTSVIEPLARFDRVLVGLYRHGALA